jgi:hypothetical protein
MLDCCNIFMWYAEKVLTGTLTVCAKTNICHQFEFHKEIKHHISFLLFRSVTSHGHSNVKYIALCIRPYVVELAARHIDHFL